MSIFGSPAAMSFGDQWRAKGIDPNSLIPDDTPDITDRKVAVPIIRSFGLFDWWGTFAKSLPSALGDTTKERLQQGGEILRSSSNYLLIGGAILVVILLVRK